MREKIAITSSVSGWRVRTQARDAFVTNNYFYYSTSGQKEKARVVVGPKTIRVRLALALDGAGDPQPTVRQIISETIFPRKNYMNTIEIESSVQVTM